MHPLLAGTMTHELQRLFKRVFVDLCRVCAGSTIFRRSDLTMGLQDWVTSRPSGLPTSRPSRPDLVALRPRCLTT